MAVVLDNGDSFTLSAGVALDWGLFQGRELRAEERAKILHKDRYTQGMAGSLHLIGYRPRTEMEIRRHLGRRRFDDAIVDAIVDRLRELRYLDDAAFAASWLEARSRISPRGGQALRRELLGKGVAPEIVDQSLESVADEETALRAAEHRSRRLAAADYPVFRKKLSGFLRYRGFSAEVIRLTVQRVWEDREQSG